MNKKSSLTKASHIIEETLKNLKADRSFKVYPIWKQWPQIVGETIAAKCEATYVQGKILVVTVTNSVWMNELGFQKRQILEKIKELIPESTVEDIRFQLKRE
ncbi:MAG TPA: hypothetical protein DDW49_08700 [Deltaproteobacteria bacterium]|nr:MAG: hypothetical protein A2048_03280 [Deltaproteobacteria bacterium GWA2_45_12]HBF13444.1 hypothetical protein [Deltaproteobacteria bacterium]